MDGAIFFKNLRFFSNDYVIYKNGNDITGHCYGYWREIRIKQNREAGELYRVTINKLEAGGAIRGKLLPATEMMLAEQDNWHIELRNPDYELILQLVNHSVETITLKRYTSSADTVFIKAPAKELEKAINIPLAVHIAGLNVSVNKAVGNELIERYQRIVKEIETKGRAAETVAAYYLFPGKIYFSQGVYREAKEAFTQCLMILTFNGLQPDHDAIYHYAIVKETEGYTSEAKMFYRLALERYTDNAGLVSRDEIMEALNR